MCGIAGALGSIGEVDTASVLAALAHRGPDGQGEYRARGSRSDELWLGHRRLAIMDPTRNGAQPMSTPDGRFTIVFNGEIYNFRELRAELSAFEPRTRCDTEVLLALLAQKGIDGLANARGMFALALWDNVERTLLLARDRLGQKPLYYYEGAGCFLFASEVRALLASSAVPRALCDDGLDAYLTFGSVADPYTLVAGVRALGAGSYLTLRDGRVETGTYWRMSATVPDLGLARADAVREIGATLRQAVSRCMVADVPIGVLLSGGIDSSANVALLAELGHRDLPTFTVAFGEEDSALSEERYAALVAKRFGTRHTTVTIGAREAPGMVAEAVSVMDQPSHDGINTYLVSRAIRRTGLKVAITGQGADELFLGYRQHAHFAGLVRLARAIPRGAGRVVERALQTLWGGRGGGLGKIAQLGSGPDPVGAAYLAQHSVFSRTELERLRGQARPHPARFVRDVLPADPLDLLSRLQLHHYLGDTLLRDADQMSMALGLELRGPFLDVDLAESVLRVPGRLKVDGRRNKPLLLDAVGPVLPSEAWDRPKQGFELPMARWLRGGLRGGGDTPPGLDRAACQRVRDTFLGASPGSPRDYIPFWTLEVLGAWVHAHGLGPVQS